MDKLVKQKLDDRQHSFPPIFREGPIENDEGYAARLEEHKRICKSLGTKGASSNGAPGKAY